MIKLIDYPLLLVVYGSIGTSIAFLILNEIKGYFVNQLPSSLEYINKIRKNTWSRIRLKYRTYVYRHIITIRQDGTPGVKSDQVLLINSKLIKIAFPPQNINNTSIWYFRISSPEFKENMSLTYNTREKCFAEFERLSYAIGASK